MAVFYILLLSVSANHRKIIIIHRKMLVPNFALPSLLIIEKCSNKFCTAVSIVCCNQIVDYCHLFNLIVSFSCVNACMIYMYVCCNCYHFW